MDLKEKSGFNKKQQNVGKQVNIFNLFVFVISR